ncbi:hypothetical protein [Luteipulveratus mongoliensis]|uniref:hypothetical protein n=1 Tax=Luteipulveratus mongoliensis TaxID=571913 RepID=UPI00069877FB|nr:hypothetical protein [Luteipulveratus mongoliensis]
MTSADEPSTSLRELLWPVGTLHRAGVASTGAQPEHQRLRQGTYVDRTTWQALEPREQLALRVHAVDCLAEDDHLFSHHSAAALWGLPIIGQWPELVEHTTPAGTAGRTPGVRRRRAKNLPEGVIKDDVLVTAPARTVIDLAREVRLESAVAAADHALRLELCTVEELQAECDLLPKGARRKRNARRVVCLADPLSESVGESLSRVRMYQLGPPKPVLQINFTDARGLIGRVDFWWEGYALIGEFDGRVKYRVPEGASADEASAVLWKEKQREDRLSAGERRVRRWVWDDAYHLERFRQVMDACGLRPIPVDTWLCH